MRTRYVGGASACALLIAASGVFSNRAIDHAHAGGGYYRLPLGSRELRLGDRGADVKTPNWALRSESLDAPLLNSFGSPTDSAVRALQLSAGLAGDGVVSHLTMKAIAGRLPVCEPPGTGLGYGGAAPPAARRSRLEQSGWRTGASRAERG